MSNQLGTIVLEILDRVVIGLPGREKMDGGWSIEGGNRDVNLDIRELALEWSA
jgi:hypothetical protein